METLSPKEQRLIIVFLKEFKKMVQERVNIPFNPRSLTLISQPDMKNENRFDYISYNKWFDELAIQTHIGSSTNLFGAFLDIPINILISAEQVKKPFISPKDHKKLMKALKLLNEIKLEQQT